MPTLHQLADDVAKARTSFIKSASGLSAAQSSFKPADDAWTVIDNVEHLVWAEMGGVNGMWKALEGFRKGMPIFSGDATHHGLHIEAIIEKTWKAKEQVPEVAKPRWGGPVEYWIASLQNCQHLLVMLTNAMNGTDPEKVIYPHVLSGPLNVVQRFEFLRFHLNRHEAQIGRIKSDINYPR